MSYEEKIKIYQNMIRNLEIELKHYEGTPYFEDEEFKIRERINMHKDELRLYKQAAKADEYEAKAKAFDRIVKERNQAGTAMYGKDDDVFYRVIERAFWNIDGIIVDYESGESDAKK